MKIETQEAFALKYPAFFRDLWGSPQETCLAFGLEVGDGWVPLIDKLCEDLVALDLGPDFKIDQIKEKFGGLRFYVGGYPSDKEKSKQMSALISAAEEESYKICERCGTQENVTVEGSWVKTLCKPCREGNEANPSVDWNEIEVRLAEVEDRRKAKKNREAK